ncbi:kinase [Myxococcus phage Mx1]|nr:kinase [Myxococcus phage Mx1]
MTKPAPTHDKALSVDSESAREGFATSWRKPAPLQKAVKGYSFTEPVPDGSGWQHTIHAVHNGKRVGTLVFTSKPNATPGHPHQGYHKIQEADVSALHRGNGIYGRLLQNASMWVKKQGSRGLVSPGPFRSEAASGAWDRLSTKVKAVQRRPSPDPDAPDFFLHEKEVPEALQGFTSEENIRHEWLVEFKRWLEKKPGVGTPEEIDEALEHADTAAAATAVMKSEPNPLGELAARHGNLVSGPTEEDQEIARHMSGFDSNTAPEFEAARFLAGGVRAPDDSVRIALILYDHDTELAALRAYGLPRNDAYRRLLRSTMEMKALKKGEFDVSAIPRDIRAAVPEAEPCAKALRRALAAGAIHSIKLDGKHSKGTAVATDPETGRKWLVKPGSGKLSPAAGVREEAASQSRREAAFYEIAAQSGLEAYLPETHLILMDGVETAVMELLAADYKGLEKLRRTKSLDPVKLFEKYRKDGTLFKWAFLDWVLGNADRHANNIMVSPDHEVKLIDHGTTFAGQSFNPANDPKSFVPFYLRAWKPNSFSAMDAGEKEAAMPTLDHHAEAEFGAWTETLPFEAFVQIMQKYGINPEPALARWNQLRRSRPEFRAHQLVALWSGALPSQS